MQTASDGTERTLYFANVTVRETFLRALFGPVRWNLVVARVRHGAIIEALDKPEGAAWVPLRVRAWHFDGIRAAINFLGEAASNKLIPLLKWEELGQASRGALLAAIHALLARADGLVGQENLRNYGGLVLGDDVAVQDAWNRMVFSRGAD